MLHVFVVLLFSLRFVDSLFHLCSLVKSLKFVHLAGESIILVSYLVPKSTHITPPARCCNTRYLDSAFPDLSEIVEAKVR